MGDHGLIEVKTTRGALSKAELKRKLAYADKLDKGDSSFLWILSPDPIVPPGLVKIDDKRVRWCNFATVAASFNALLDDKDGREVLGERDRFLVRELLDLFAEEGLLGQVDTVVVAGQYAYPWYLAHSGYICQPNRSFRPVERFAFYHGKEIKPEIPLIIAKEQGVVFDRVELTEWTKGTDEAKQQVALVALAALDDASRSEGSLGDIYVLSPAKSGDTIRLRQPIKHQSPGPWLRGQRYATAKLLQGADTTADLNDNS